MYEISLSALENLGSARFMSPATKLKPRAKATTHSGH